MPEIQSGLGGRGLAVLAYWTRVKIRDIIRAIEQDGWFHVRTTGSHRQFRHPTKPGKVTVAGKLNRDLHPKTLASIRRQAGLP